MACRQRPEDVAAADDLSAVQTFTLNGDMLDWTLTLRNDRDQPIQVGDLAVPFNFAERTGARGDIYTKKLLRHAFVGGHGSFVYWQRSNGEGPYLVMTPVGRDEVRVLRQLRRRVHALRAREAAAAMRRRNWRLPVSSLTLAPKETVRYAFRFQWAKDFAGVRDVLFDEGKFDTAIVPGMVVPRDLPAMISLRTKNTITAIEPEHPATTSVVVQPAVSAARLIPNSVYRVTLLASRREHAARQVR